MWRYGPDWWGMMPYGGWTQMGWHMFFGPIFWILLLVLATMGIVRATRRSGGARDDAKTQPGTSQALTTLDERYARSEIGRDEYLEKKRDLQPGGASPPGNPE
jgi:putative membrane protein